MRITQGGLVGVGTQSPTARLDVLGTISSSDAIQVSGSSLTCSSAIKGAIRYSNTSSTLEYCNSTAWTSVGPSSSVPAFAVHKNGADQTLTASTWMKMTWSTENFDTNNNFATCSSSCNSGDHSSNANSRFTPIIPGKYLVNLQVYCSNGNGCIPAIYKNGGASAWQQNTLQSMGSVIALVDMNGTSDYLEGYVYNNGGTTLSGASNHTFFSGFLISGGSSGGGGGATPGGTDTQVQFNDGGSALGGDADYTWSKTSNLLTITGTLSGTVHNGLTASITTIYNPGTFSGNAMAANTISVTYVSSSVVQVSGSSLTCSSAIKGAIRYSNTSSTLEYCNSTAWTSLGPSATTVPAFSVHKNGTNQTVTVNSTTLLTWSTEEFDSNNNFASNRFTPTIAGKYLVVLSAYCVNAATYCSVAITKNGSAYKTNGANYGSGFSIASAAAIIDFNGTSDYAEATGTTDGTTINGPTTQTFFQGTLIAPYGQGGGGGATPGGTDTQVQFNDGGSALGGDADYTWNKTSNVLTVTGDINYTGLLTDTSDRRQKKNIQEFSGDALERLMKLRPVTFQMKQGGSGVEYGFIAQDVLPLFPELVRDRDDTLSLNYIGMMAPMVKAMQQMKAENDVVAAQNRQLRETLHNLAVEMKTLRKAVARSQTLH